MIIDFEDFRSVALASDFHYGIGSLFKQVASVTTYQLRQTSGLTSIMSTIDAFQHCISTIFPTTKKIAVRMDLEFGSTSSMASYGFSNHIYNENATLNAKHYGGFYFSLLQVSGMAGYFTARLFHGSLLATGGTVSSAMISESAPFEFKAGTKSAFDFMVNIGADDMASVKLSKDGAEIVSGSININRVDSGRQVKEMNRLNMCPHYTHLSNVAIYEPDATHPWPIYDVEILRNAPTDANLGAAPANDATSVLYANNAWTDIPLSGVIPGGTQIVAAKAVFRHTAGGGNTVAYPEFALDFQDGVVGQLTGRPTPEGTQVGQLPTLVEIRAPGGLTPALINGARLRARSRTAPAV